MKQYDKIKTNYTFPVHLCYTITYGFLLERKEGVQNEK